MLTIPRLVSLLAVVPVLTLAQAPFNSTNIVLFCSSRPLGLYCDPTVPNHKIECPAGKTYSCPETYGPEICQERGVLKQSGFKGGIARCVPDLGPAAVSDFCATKSEPGSYCYGDDDNNILVLCPTGLIYKCADQPTVSTRKCFQATNTSASCSVNINTNTMISSNTLIQYETRTLIQVDAVTRSFASTSTQIMTQAAAPPVTWTSSSVVIETGFP